MKNFFKKLFCSDSMSKHFSETVQRVGKNNAGFSLVELIVVIAIMAILAAVAVIGVSVYIPKAQQAADEQLVNDVKQAITLYYYSNPDAFTDCYVVLKHESISGGSTANTLGAAVMEESFGADWNNKAVLKYDGWVGGAYDGSSYQGNEVALMGKVEDLTGLLGDTIADQPSLIGSNFKNFMSSELGFSSADMENPDKAADAAVLYVANGTSNLTEEQQKEFAKIASDAAGQADMFGYMLNEYSKLYGSHVMGAAATYAMLTAYCQYEDKKAGNTNMMDALGTPNGDNVSSGTVEEMNDLIMDSVSRLDELLEEGNGLNFEEYWTEVASKDASAFVDVMGTVSSSKDQVVDKLGTDGCFTSQELQDVFTGYGEGAITIIAKVQEDGTLKFTTLPELDENK